MSSEKINEPTTLIGKVLTTDELLDALREHERETFEVALGGSAGHMIQYNKGIIYDTGIDDCSMAWTSDSFLFEYPEGHWLVQQIIRNARPVEVGT